MPIYKQTDRGLIPIKVFIDSNILDRIKELESLPIKLEYYYPEVDLYHIKQKHLPEEKLPPQRFLFYQKAAKALKEAAQTVGDKSRFHIVSRPDQTQPIQSFSFEGPISNVSGIKFFRGNKKIISSTLGRIRRAIPTVSITNKDLYVLLTVILCNDKKDLFAVAQYDWINDKRYYDFTKSVSLFNPDGKKYFVTLDKTGIFKRNSIQNIEQEFPDIKIFYLNDFKVFLSV